MKRCDCRSKVSVIIPVYNTGAFLPRCIESVLNQTYPFFELIIINDGSTDDSEKCCLQYAAQDSRIKYLFQENKGQGAARNLGMKIAEGEYFTFLDSDDYWDKDYIESMLELSNSTDSDISICAYRLISENGDVIRKSVKYPDGLIKTYTGIEAANNILYWIDFGAAPWAKLYKRDVWEGLFFPEDRIYEDLAITYKVCLNAKKISFTSDTKMSYCLRLNSDIRMQFKSKKLKVLDTADEILEFAISDYPELIKAAKSRVVATSFFILFQMPPKSLQLSSSIKRCKTNIRKYRMGVVFDRSARRKTRIGALVSFWGFGICRKIFMFFKSRDISF